MAVVNLLLTISLNEAVKTTFAICYRTKKNIHSPSLQTMDNHSTLLIIKQLYKQTLNNRGLYKRITFS